MNSEKPHCENAAARSVRPKRTGKAKGGRPSLLTPYEKEVIRECLTTSPREFGFERSAWTVPMIADLIEQKTGKELHQGSLWGIAADLGWLPYISP